MQMDRQALRRVQDALLHLRDGLAQFVEARMRQRHGPSWREAAQRATGSPSKGPLDAYALLKTLIYWWPDTFRDAFEGPERHRARSLVTLTLDARNAAAHATGGMSDADALRALDAMHELLRLSDAPAVEVAALKSLYDAQRREGGGAAEPEPRKVATAQQPSHKSGTHADRLLAYVRAHPGLDDDELSLRLDIKPRQTINMIARRLEGEGMIERVPGPRNKIVNRPTKAKP